MRKNFLRSLALTGATAVGLATAATSFPTPAQACGGFFCSAANPVNQAAEQIVFSQNADGTVTAVIEIQYEGPSTHFAWLLPVAGSPKVEVSSAQAFVALRQVSDPQYNLQTVFEDGCAQSRGAVDAGVAFSPSASGTGGTTGGADNGGVTVVASGAIGPYDYEVISVKTDQKDPAQAAIDWLTTNKYDVGMTGPDVLRPYLEMGTNLLAIRLQKGASTGSIRPVMITYESPLPLIPIRPTAVAANDDMGVLVWVLANSRAIPSNYKALELNEALINWFMPNTNYNDVVSRAANEAGGQGFVTEFAGKTSNMGLSVMIFPQYQQDMWDQFSAMTFSDPVEMIQQANNNWGSWDGFDDALQDAVTLPDTIAFEDFKLCTRCYIGSAGVTFDTTVYLQKLFEKVIKPMINTQKLLDSRPYMTRLYTTMSADEMTEDPVFDFNADIADVSNIHSAKRTIECPKGGTGDPTSSPWHVDLPQGGTVHGTEFNVWPVAIDDQPAALKILQFGTTGQGKVNEDRTDKITKLLAQGTKPESKSDAGVDTSSGGTGGKDTQPTAGKGGSTEMSSSGSGSDDAGAHKASTAHADDTGNLKNSKSNDGCSVGSVGSSTPANALSLLLLSLAALFSRRRRSA